MGSGVRGACRIEPASTSSRARESHRVRLYSSPRVPHVQPCRHCGRRMLEGGHMMMEEDAFRISLCRHTLRESHEFVLGADRGGPSHSRGVVGGGEQQTRFTTRRSGSDGQSPTLPKREDTRSRAVAYDLGTLLEERESCSDQHIACFQAR